MLRVVLYLLLNVMCLSMFCFIDSSNATSVEAIAAKSDADHSTYQLQASLPSSSSSGLAKADVNSMMNKTTQLKTNRRLTVGHCSTNL